MVHIRAIYSSVEDVGKNLKKTKKHYLWKFSINEREHILELYASTISRKKKIMLNGTKVYKDQKVLTVNFFHQLLIDQNTIHVFNSHNKFDILINNEPFQRFYNDDYDSRRDDHSYRHSKSMVSRASDKYNNEKRLRNNMERDDFAPRAKFNGDKYYTNQESIDSWNEIGQKKTNSGEKDYHRSRTNYEEHYDGNLQSYFERNGSYEEHDYRYHENQEPVMTRASNAFEQYESKPQTPKQGFPQAPSLHHSKSMAQKPVSNFSPPQNNSHKVTVHETQKVQTPTTTTFFDFQSTHVVKMPKEETTTAPVQTQQATSNPTPAPTTTLANDLIDLSNAFTNITDLYKQAPVLQLEQAKPEVVAQPEPVAQTTVALVADPNKKNDLWNRNDLIDLTNFGDKENQDPNKKKESEFLNFQLPSVGPKTNSTNNFVAMNSMNTTMNNSMPNMNGMMTMNSMSSMNTMNSMNPMNNMGMGYMGMQQQYPSMTNSSFGNPMLMNSGMGYQMNNNMGMGMNMGGMNYGMGQLPNAYSGFGTNY